MTEFSSATPTRSAVGRWSVDRYISLTRPWVILAALVCAALILFRVHQIAVTTVPVATCIWIGLQVHRRQGRRIEAMTAGAMAGLALGLTTGLARFILQPSAYWFINIPFESLLFGFVGAMLSVGLIVILTTKKAYHRKT